MNEEYTLPEGWQWVKLGEACEFCQYGLTATATDSGKFPIIRITDIDDVGNIKIDGIKFVDCDKNIYEKYALKERDILFARSGSIGRTFLYNGIPPKAIFASYLIRFRLKQEIVNPLWLFHYTHSPEYYRFIEEKKHTVSQPNINAEEYKSLLIPLPLIDEQRRIAVKVQELMQEVERAQAACEKQLEAAKSLPSAYLREVFESEEAKKWERKKLGEVLEVIESGSRPKGGVFEIKEGILSIGAEHLTSFGGFNFDKPRFIPNEFYRSMTKGKIQKEDVLVVKDGATTGKVSFVEDNFPYAQAAINEHVFRLRGGNFLYQKFLFWFLYSPLGQTQIQQEFHGAAQGGINQQFVNGVCISIPPLFVQQRIATELKQKMAQVQNLQSAILNQQSALDALPQAILRKAFRGEL